MSSVFEEILKGVTAEDKAVIDRHPELASAVAKLEKDLAGVSQYASGWVDWQKQNWDPDSGMTKAEKALREQLAEAEARAITGGGSPADVNSALATARSEFDAKLKAMENNSMSAIEGMNRFYSSVSGKILTHRDEFKETLDPNKLMQFMQSNKINDPDLAYDRMVADQRSQNALKQKEADEVERLKQISEAEQRGYEKKAQEVSMGPEGMLPTDQSGGIAGITGRVGEPAKISDADAAKLAAAKLGDGSLATLGFQMYRNGQLPVQ